MQGCERAVPSHGHGRESPRLTPRAPGRAGIRSGSGCRVSAKRRISATIGGGFSTTTGAETVQIGFEAQRQSGDPARDYPAIIELIGTNPQMGVFYITTDDVTTVERSTRTGQVFTDPVVQPGCSPVFFTLME